MARLLHLDIFESNKTRQGLPQVRSAARRAAGAYLDLSLSAIVHMLESYLDIDLLPFRSRLICTPLGLHQTSRRSDAAPLLRFCSGDLLR